MDDITKVYGAESTLAQLQTTCEGDEDAHRARLKRFRRVQKADGTKGTEATYRPVPNNEEFPSKDLFFFDVTNTSPEQERDISKQQMQQGHVLAVEKTSGQVFLNNNPASVLVFREG